MDAPPWEGDLPALLHRLCAREALAVLVWEGAAVPVRMLEVTGGSVLVDMPMDRGVPIRLEPGERAELVVASGEVRLGLRTRVRGPIVGVPSSLGALALEAPAQIRIILGRGEEAGPGTDGAREEMVGDRGEMVM